MNEVWDEMDFLHADKYERFTRVQLCFTCYFLFETLIDSDERNNFITSFSSTNGIFITELFLNVRKQLNETL